VRTLEVVRHSLTRKGADKRKASHLSADGVRLARQLSESMARMDYVAVGDEPRHLETAIAMGVRRGRADRMAFDAVLDDGAALVVSSGGSIEPVLVAAFPDADHASWGGPFHQLEGATVLVEGGQFTSVALRRRPRVPRSSPPDR
jgi:hypothetical protein